MTEPTPKPEPAPIYAHPRELYLAENVSLEKIVEAWRGRLVGGKPLTLKRAAQLATKEKWFAKRMIIREEAKAKAQAVVAAQTPPAEVKSAISSKSRKLIAFAQKCCYERIQEWRNVAIIIERTRLTRRNQVHRRGTMNEHEAIGLLLQSVQVERLLDPKGDVPGAAITYEEILARLERSYAARHAQPGAPSVTVNVNVGKPAGGNGTSPHGIPGQVIDVGAVPAEPLPAPPPVSASHLPEDPDDEPEPRA